MTYPKTQTWGVWDLVFLPKTFRIKRLCFTSSINMYAKNVFLIYLFAQLTFTDYLPSADNCSRYWFFFEIKGFSTASGWFVIKSPQIGKTSGCQIFYCTLLLVKEKRKLVSTPFIHIYLKKIIYRYHWYILCSFYALLKISKSKIKGKYKQKLIF